MTLKTTKEQRDAIRNEFNEWTLEDLCDDVDALEREIAELRAKLNEAYERAAQVCEFGNNIPEDEIQDYLDSQNSGDIAKAQSCMESRALAKAIRALKG